MKKRCVIIGGAEITDYSAIRAYLQEGDCYIFCDSGMKHQNALGVVPDLIVGDFDSWNMEDFSEAMPALLNRELNYHEVREDDVTGMQLDSVLRGSESPLEGKNFGPELSGCDSSLENSDICENYRCEYPAQKDDAKCAGIHTSKYHESELKKVGKSFPKHPEVRLLPHDKYDSDTVYGVREGIDRGFDDFLILGVIGQRFDHTLSNLYLLTFLKAAGKHGLIVDDYSEMELVFQEPALISDCFSSFSLMNITGKAKGVKIENARYCYLPGEEITQEYQYGLSNEVLPGQTAQVSVEDGCLLLIRNR